MKRTRDFIGKNYPYLLPDFIDGFGDMTTWNYWMSLDNQYRIIKDRIVDLHMEFDNNLDIFTNFRLIDNTNYTMNYSTYVGAESQGMLLVQNVKNTLKI